MPANAAWPLGKVAGGANGVSTGSPFEGVREGGRSVRNAVADTLPFGKDSLELRIERTRDALDMARQAGTRGERGRGRRRRGAGEGRRATGAGTS
ncbi:MAG: hypothetical protein WKF58_17015 [Ilumatobacteraceae bacterium]